MKTSDLIALAEQRGTLADTSRALGVNADALAMARYRGKLSPALAATLAAYLGEPVARWTLAAVAESERSAPLRRRLAALVRNV
jgi:hypothetical protein